jgi:hypothetical protein
LIGVLSSFAALMFCQFHHKKIGIRWLVWLGCGVLGIIIGGRFLLAFYPNYIDFLERVKGVTSDVRLDIWGQAAGILWETPLGGGRAKLTESVFAHNLFLDLAMDYGFLGLGLGLAVAAYLAARLWRSLRRMRANPSVLSMCLLCIVVSHFLAMMVEPILPQRLIVALLAVFALLFINDVRMGNSIGLRHRQGRPKFQAVKKQTTY